jgi:hypothetical protein
VANEKAAIDTMKVRVNQIVCTAVVQCMVATNAALIIALNPLMSSLIAAPWLGNR